MASSSNSQRGEYILSTPGPIRRRPRNGAFKHLSTPYGGSPSQNTLNNNANDGWFPTLRGFLRRRPIATVATVGRVLAGGLAGSGQSLWQYVTKTTRTYLGLVPPPVPRVTALTDGSLREAENQRAREKAARYYERQAQAQSQSPAETQTAQPQGEPSRSATTGSTQASTSTTPNLDAWTAYLARNVPQHSMAAKIGDEEVVGGIKTIQLDSDALEDTASRPSSPQDANLGPKEEFQKNFKSDPSQDADKIKFIESYTGWKLATLRHKSKIYQTLPNLKNGFDYTEDHTENIARLADILSDRGFLKRQRITAEITFEPFWGRPAISNEYYIPKVYIPANRFEPLPSYQPREFSVKERQHMKKHGYGPIKKEWQKQTIYDLVFHTPSDGPLPEDQIEIPDEDFEVARDDPRFRQLWNLLPAVRIPGNSHMSNSGAGSRLQYKRAVSRRDYWFWKLIKEIEKRDRQLAKVFTHFDLNRKRTELSWNEYRRVELVRTEDLSMDDESAIDDEVIQDVAEEEIIVDTFRPNVRISEQYLPDAVAKRRETQEPIEPKTLDERQPTPYKMYNPKGKNTWKSQYADLSDEDNFPSGHVSGKNYSSREAVLQGRRLARGLGENFRIDLDRNGKQKSGQNKKVTFAPGHTLRVFEHPDESDVSGIASPSPTQVRPTKKMKAAGEKPVQTAQSSVTAGPRKAALPVQNLAGGSKPTNSKVPQNLTRPATVGRGSSDPKKMRYQNSLVEVPREWRGASNTFSAWEEDYQDAGVFYEIDVVDGKLPKGVGTWETELEQTHGPKRVRVMRTNGSEQDFVVWDKDGLLRDLDWVPEETEKSTEEAVEKEVEVADGDVMEETTQEGLQKSPTMDDFFDNTWGPATEEEAEKWWSGQGSLKDTMRMYVRERHRIRAEQELAQKQVDALKKKEAELAKAHGFLPPVMRSKKRRSSENSPVKSPLKSTEITGEFPIFNPFGPQPGESVESDKASLSRTSSGNLPSPPLSNEEDNSGKEDVPSTPGSKAKARLTGLFDPVQSQKGPSFTVVEDPKNVEKPATQSFQSEVTAPSSQGSEQQTGSNDVFRPIVNGATLPRLGSTGEIPKAQALLPPAPVTTQVPMTPSAITPAEAGMFGAVRPSPKGTMISDEGSSMDIDNTPQSQKKNRSPKEFAAVTAASTTMAETFKPTVPATFDFGSMNTTKPLFGADILPKADNAASKPFVFGTPEPSKITSNPFQFGASTAAPSIFGASIATDKPTDSNPLVFGASRPADKPADAPFVFGNKPAEKLADAPFSFGAKPTEKPADAPFLFGSKPAEKAPEAPFAFGAQTTGSLASTSMFGTNAPAPSINFGMNKPADKPAESIFNFGGQTTAPAPNAGIFSAITAPSTAAPSIFGTSSAAPSAPSMFGAASGAPTTNGLFGAVSGVTAASSTTPASTPFEFSATTTAPAIFSGNNATTSSASFTFGSTATTQPMQFGGELSKPTSTSFNGSFNFGAKSETPAGFNFGAPSPAPSGPSAPVFGASNPGTPNPGASFGGDAGNNVFGYQPQTTNSFGRNIKAPVSRKAGSMRKR